MLVVLEGRVEVVSGQDDDVVSLCVLRKGEGGECNECNEDLQEVKPLQGEENRA